MDILAQSTYLIIDDSNIIQSATRALLMKLGVPTNNVVSAPNAESAINACRKRRFDILLIDHHLGAGSTGLQLLEYLRFKGLIKEQTLVFVVTGNDSQDIFFGYSQFEPDGYLIKPIRADDIIKRVKSTLMRQRYFNMIEGTFNKNGLNAVKPLFAKSPDTATLKEAIIYMANILIKEQQFTDARAMLTGLLKIHNFLPAKMKLIEISLAQKNFQQALFDTDLLLSDNARNIKLLQLKVEICISAELHEKADEVIRRILAINTSNMALTVNMIWLQLASNDMVQAKPFLLKLASLLPNSMWDTPGKRALTLWADMFDQPTDKLRLWRAENIWPRIARSDKAPSLSKSVIKLIRALQLIRLDEMDTARDMMQTLSADEFHENDIEAHYLLCLCYQALNLQQHLGHLRTPMVQQLNQQGVGLPNLQKLALQHVDYQSISLQVEVFNMGRR
ncbi:response regulator [Photobacterium kagoshimensis]|uniref:response regulator n=1 Tax=Photobacterium kagoshimensis TaxID=2910242 RepID=UPI003D0E6B5D